LYFLKAENMNEEKLNIVIIEDNKDVRQGFVLLINASDKYQVVGDYCDAESALENLIEDVPNVILMDIDLPGIDGIEATRRARQVLPHVNIIIITVFENSSRVYDALCAGATGYLTKNTNQIGLLNAIDEVVHGGAPMSANIARMIVESFQRNTQTPLSERETEVLVKLSDGKSYKSIADQLEIGLTTVKFHIKNIYIKLQVNNKEDAITLAKKQRYI
jgi:DNA-binding NarL/FixJ family response regulator